MFRSNKKHTISVRGSLEGEEFDGTGTSTVDVKKFLLSTVILATDNFSLDHKVGQGGFGSVYKVLSSLISASNC